MNIDQQYFILQSESVRQLVNEIENLEKNIKYSEKEGFSKSEITLIWMQTVTTKEAYRAATGLVYEPPIDANREEKNILKELFNNLKGCNWKKNYGWITTDLNLSDEIEINMLGAAASLFDGIKLTNIIQAKSSSPIPLQRMNSNNQESKYLKSTVSSIDLSGYGCEGSLPENICHFTECKFLHLHWNLISGHLPKNFSSMGYLLSISLSGNLLEGTLDMKSFQYFKNLKRLDLSFNKFSGNIPNMFEFMKSLEELILSGNYFSGELPNSLKFCKQLQILKLYSNQLSGNLAYEIFSELKELKLINLSNNQFTSGLNALFQCNKLEHLQINHNQIKDKIDSSIENVIQLKLFYGQNNQLHGTLPVTICNLKMLKLLNLSNNQLRGCIPHEIGQLNLLESLLLSNNSIIGPVPISLGNLKQLRDFHVFTSYPAEWSMTSKSFHRHHFERVYVFGPKAGINSMCWDYKELYGREKIETDDESVTVFSGSL